MCYAAPMSVFVLQGAPNGSSKRIDYAKELNQEQLDVVLHGDGACLVLAGAGSGKTRALTYRVAYLLEQGLDPSSLLLLTFTNKAAKEMLARVTSLIGPAAQGIWGGTFHSIANRILHVSAEQVGYGKNFSILDSEDSRALIKAILKDARIDVKTRRFPSPAVLQDIISFARNTQHPLQEVLNFKHASFAPLFPEIEQIAKSYQERKQVANVMDFDDLLTNLARLLDDEAMGTAISSRFQAVLVDEYQDTNAIQARLVKGFSRVHKQVLVVGDDAQSIYAFRGADVENILSFPKTWPDAKMLKLTTNYRSTPQILELANESLEHNQNQFEKHLVSVREAGDKPKFVSCASAAQEAQYIAEQMLVLRSEGTALRNMAVLFRSSAHSQLLEFELMKRNIPYEYRGGQKFFERAHIKDVLAFLRVRANTHDEVAWLRVLNLQPGIGASTAANLVAQVKRYDTLAEALNSDQICSLSARAKTGFQQLTRMASGLIEGDAGPAVLIRAVIDSPYQEYLEKEYPNWKERVEDLEQLALFAESYDQLPTFLSDISLYDEALALREGATRPDDERVVLSTIHQAKGLEWDTVFIMHLADNAFPNRRALAEEGGMEEERRLFYVAVTRAQRRLFLTYPITLGHDAFAFNQPSTFIDEVSSRLFERVQIVAPHKRSARWGSSGEESSWDEPTVEVDGIGERRLASSSATVWKPSAIMPGKIPPNQTFNDESEDLPF